MTYLGDLVGNASPLDPTSMKYKAVAARERGTKNNPELACQGCLFKGQKSKICVQAGQLARQANMADCEDIDFASRKTFIYVAIETDPRQIDLINQLENNDNDAT